MTKRHYPTRPVPFPAPTLVRPRPHPPPPSTLAKEEQQLWDAIYAEYQIEGTAAEIVLLKACNASFVERSCVAEIKRNGVMVKGKLNPLLKASSEARHSFLACLRALNINLGPER